MCCRVYQYYAQHYSLGVLRKLTWLVFVSYLMPYILCFRRLSRRFLKEFSSPANTMLDGKLFQLRSITLLLSIKKRRKNGSRYKSVGPAVSWFITSRRQKRRGNQQSGVWCEKSRLRLKVSESERREYGGRACHKVEDSY